MTTTGKIAVGVGIASGALLVAWLLTGTRKQKTRSVITKGTERLRQTLKKAENRVFEDSEAHYF